MPGINARSKGQRGERELAALLQPVVTKVYQKHLMEAPVLERNLMQSMKGGYDLVGLDWLAIEIKRHEAITAVGGISKGGIASWWDQTVRQAGPGQEPVLFFRPNNWSWTVRCFGYLPVGPNGGVRIKAPMQCELPSWLLWFEYKLDYELTKAPTIQQQVISERGLFDDR